MADAELTPPTPEEFENWLTPQQVLRVLKHLPDGTAVRTVMLRVWKGLIQTAARDGTRTEYGYAPTPLQLFPIHGSWWDGVGGIQDPHSDFWLTGTAIFKRPKFQRSDTVYHLFGTRFRRDQIMALREPEDVATTAPVQAPKPPTSGVATMPEVRAWHDALGPEDRAKGIRWIWPEVQKALRPKRVQKKLALELVRGRERGRPKGSK